MHCIVLNALKWGKCNAFVTIFNFNLQTLTTKMQMHCIVVKWVKLNLVTFYLTVSLLHMLHVLTVRVNYA